MEKPPLRIAPTDTKSLELSSRPSFEDTVTIYKAVSLAVERGDESSVTGSRYSLPDVAAALLQFLRTYDKREEAVIARADGRIFSWARIHTEVGETVVAAVRSLAEDDPEKLAAENGGAYSQYALYVPSAAYMLTYPAQKQEPLF